MPDLSDIKFPDYITYMKGKGRNKYLGGFNYQTQHNGWTSATQVNQCEMIDVGSHLITPAAENSMETDWIDCFEFPNGYKLQIKIVLRINGTSNNSTSRLVDNLGNVVTSSITGFSLANSNYSGGYNVGAMVGYLILTTQYYPTADPPAGTSNNGLSFNLSLGFPASGYTRSKGLTYGNDIVGSAPYIGTIATWSSLSGFETFMAGHGDPYEGTIFSDAPLPKPEDDTSGTGGGNGNYDNDSDPIDFPDLPTGGALSVGAIKAFLVANTTVEALFSKLWDTSIFNVLTWQKLTENPLDCIISLHCIPVLPEVGDMAEIKIGSYNSELRSRVITNQYIYVDMGSLDVEEFWGSALDYSPYTRCEIFLPGIGIKDLAVEDVQNKTIHVKYAFDVLTGTFTAFIKCGISVLYKYSGNLMMQVPITSRSTDAYMNTILGTAKIAGGAIAGTAVGGPAGGVALGAATMSAAGNVASSKIRTQRSGDLNLNAAIMDDFVPYLIFHRPKQSLAAGYNQFKGYPSNISAVLSSLTGYTEVEHIHLEGVNGATDAELEEIDTLLKRGVII